MTKYFYLSFSLHLLLVCGFLTLHFQEKSFLQKTAEPTLFAYASTWQQPMSNANKHSIYRHQTSHPPLLKKSTKTEREMLSTQTNNNVLLQMLHQAIFQKQIYPQEAILMHETGTVQLSLTVHSDGEIDQVKLVRTSGFRVIDEAAEEAVNSLSPLAAIKPYVHSEKIFLVSVVFS